MRIEEPADGGIVVEIRLPATDPLG